MRIVVANIITDSVFRPGALVEIIMPTGDNSRIQCSGIALGGRRITKWVSVYKIKNVRTNFDYKGINGMSKESAEKLVNEIKAIQDRRKQDK